MRLLPLFPLPNVVLFPKMVLPLHIFEPRYRALIKDVLAGEGVFGIPLLKPGYETAYDGRPEIHSILGYGSVQQSETLPDGKYNILIKGVGRARIRQELRSDQPYRIAEVEEMPDAPCANPAQLLLKIKRVRQHFLPLLPLYHALPQDFRETLSKLEDPEMFCHLLSMHLIENSEERQHLLESPSLEDRIAALEEWMGMESLRNLRMKHELG